ncbi:glutamine synthetase [Lysobacter sp. yr284]|uniref:glutamine synthetase family protein n=1 Tax=Lysobacter sp. yr284 TaxID=1761791 RepID=UPI000894787A|nr:glutamine synthetase family protein [Lysobacter sp. yr284]SDZ01702.1 glutamine synthetase [Lysobacter sp. yr284]
MTRTPPSIDPALLHAGAERVLDAVGRAGIELIRFLWVDHSGIARGKAVARDYLCERMTSGIGVAKCRQAADLLDAVQPLPGFGAVGEARLLPDPDTFVALPHAPGSAAMLCDLVEADGRPWGACPREFLKRAVAEAAELGFEVVAAFEPEFTLCRGRPGADGLTLFDESLCFDNAGFDLANDFAVDLVRALTGQGIGVELYHPEFGAGQHEMTCRYQPALRAADHHVWQRQLTRAAAMRHGCWATFAPAPGPGLRGNGNHVHLSLWREGRNAFADADDGCGLSPLAYRFIGGLLAHAAALSGLTCASVNSYRRLRPGMWSGAHACYGLDNREACIRIPSTLRGRENDSVNIEFKGCDATANPYLALGALIFAGLDGVRRDLHPGAPATQDPNRMSEDERRRAGIGRLPASLGEAVAALERDELLMDRLGALRHQPYLAIKRADIRSFERETEDFEFHVHATRY